MKRVLHWIKGAWVWLFADARTEMRRQDTHDGAEEDEEKEHGPDDAD